jgi:ammonium transporter
MKAPDASEVAELKKALAEARKELAAVKEDGKTGAADARVKGDTAWMLTSSAFVMLMLPGLALFYGGMVRRKNVLATMMHSMGTLAVVGLYWVVVGYALAFGPSAVTVNLLGVENGGVFGWSRDLLFLKGVATDQLLPGTNIPVYVHVMFQGMFAVITPALISGAVAERIRFWPFCLFVVLWVTFVYCPLAHMVWAQDWFSATPMDAAKGLGGSPIGLLGKMGALDFAGGTVVHIAAGMAGLAACLVLRKRDGYPKAVIHPNSMVLTLLGAGLLWFGWFGFNGGSATASSALAGSAFAATQAAATAAGLGWMAVEWLHKGKPTALGLASGIVAGLVAVTPASGFVYVWGGASIGLAAAAVCYMAVALKGRLGYDDSLDAFGVHGVGGFVGAVLTGLFCYSAVNPGGADGFFAVRGYVPVRAAELEKKLIPEAKTAGDAAAVEKYEAELTKLREAVEKGPLSQLWIQAKAAGFSVLFALALSAVLVVLTQAATRGRFCTDKPSEVEGLDRTEHGEVGFDFGYATETVALTAAEPRAATYPKGNGRFDVLVEGIGGDELLKNWTALCQPTEAPPDPDFLAVYPHVTTVSGNRFRFRGGDPAAVAARMEKLFRKLIPGKPVKAVRV